MSLLFKTGRQLPRRPAPKLLAHPSVLPSEPGAKTTDEDSAQPFSPLTVPENTETINSVKDIPLTLIFQMKEMFSDRTKEIVREKMPDMSTLQDIFALTNSGIWPENAEQAYQLTPEDAEHVRHDIANAHQAFSRMINLT